MSRRAKIAIVVVVALAAAAAVTIWWLTRARVIGPVLGSGSGGDRPTGGQRQRGLVVSEDLAGRTVVYDTPGGPAVVTELDPIEIVGEL